MGELVSFHRVREHLRSAKTHVNEYTRGKGTKVKEFTGKYGGAAALKLKAQGAAVKAKAAEKVQERIEKREEERSIRAAVREEQIAKKQEEDKAARLKRIEKEEYARAHRGNILQRAAPYAKKAAKALSGKPPRRPSRRPSRRGKKPRK